MKINNLTVEQQKFAKTRDEHILCLASAGAGKTGSLVFFIEDKIKAGLIPKNIISFSFTRKAANELKDRVKSHFNGLDFDFKYISTVHSFCWNEIIKPFHNDIGYDTVPTIIHELPDEFMEKEYKEFGKKKDRSSFNKQFTNIISKDFQKEDFTEPETVRLLQYLVGHNLVMFDLMIHLANFVLKEEAYKVKKTIGRIDYVIIDEAQDLNPAQYKFIKLLKSVFSEEDKTTRLVMVGDFKQSIYGFRGSDPKIINTFVDEFNPTIKILAHNFRSAPEIVELANKIAETIDLGNEALNESKFAKVGSNITEGDVYNIYDVEEFLD